MMSRKRRGDSEGAGGELDVEDQSKSCPYLDTIQRSQLDFDFEPSCSVSLESGPHIYACLVCGKFFRGRGRQTPAYTHSVDEGHFVFVHLTKGTFHCLPDDYEIVDPTLADISAALHPSYTADKIARLDANTGLSRDLFGRSYLPGFVGLNNLHHTDCINAIVQALAHVRPLRDFFLRLSYKEVFLPNRRAQSKSKSTQKDKKRLAPHRMSHLAQCFGELIRRMWSDQRFKSHVDPHMLIQEISAASRKRFQVGQQAEAGEFTAWFLHQLHVGLGGGKKPGSSVIHDLFQGEVEVTTRQRKIPRPDESKVKEEEGESEEEKGNKEETALPGMEIEEITATSHFLLLTLEIPEKPLFRDDDGGLVIPQEPLVTVLKKFDGVTFSDAISRSGMAQQKRYKLRKLPPYLILHLTRFKSTGYSREKNPTIVAFPVKNLDFCSYVFPKGGRDHIPSADEVRTMDISQIKALLTKYGQDHLVSNAIEKPDLIESAIDFCVKSLPDMLADKYDLVANVTHDLPADVGREGKSDPLQDGSYKCHVQHKATNQWYEIQDLHVQETMPQLIGVSESYILIFERKSAQTK